MLTRRTFIAGAAAAAVSAPAILRAQSLWRSYPFSLGVAAGDPAPDGFVIWTRIAPEPLQPDGGVGIGAATVKWEVASDDRFRTVVRSGETIARPELAHSVHVEVDGLQPDRPYWYRFEIQGERSIKGQARTLPVAGASPQALRFGVAGCQNYEEGLYTAYRHLAREELAFVYHYGDYIYEYGGDPIRAGFGGELIDPVREHVGRDLFDVDDYRRRYAQVKMDADLQRAHAAHAFFMTMDDHEVDNNWVGLISQEEDVSPDIFRLRRAAAFQAWYEHMPVRRSAFPQANGISAYRAMRYGNLAAFDFLDTRQFRTDQPCGDGFKPACAEVRSPTAQVLGAEQEAWLARNLRRDTRWNVLAQQIMMMSLDRRRNAQENAQKVLNLDSWAGYEVPRQRLLSRLAGLHNVVVLTGDEHQNFAGLLHDRDRPVAVEFVATSISSGGDGQDMRPGNDFILRNNADTLKFVNSQRGYLTCDVTPDAWTTNFMVVDRVSTPGGQLSRRAAATVPAGMAALTIA